MSFESELASLNEWHFFEEFVYSSTKFKPQPGREVELADNLVWLGDFILAFQLKERSADSPATGEMERNWFEKKVLGVGTKQIRDTLKYLEQDSIQLTNTRGHSVELRPATIKKIHKLVAYLPHPLLPDDCRQVKHHMSSTAGVIHIMSGHDYLGVVSTLLTPAEVADYLIFRQVIVGAFSSEALQVSEAALVGQDLSGKHEARPAESFLDFLRSLEHRADEWDMSGIIKRFTERTTYASGPTDYYHVIRELALLKRQELREFKLRFRLAEEKARADESALPYRLASPRTGCGFVIIPVTEKFKQNRKKLLQVLTMAHKYDQRLPRCVGVVLASDEGPWYLADWCYFDEPWEIDPQLDRFLKEANPFRPV